MAAWAGQALPAITAPTTHRPLARRQVRRLEGALPEVRDIRTQALHEVGHGDMRKAGHGSGSLGGREGVVHSDAQQAQAIASPVVGRRDGVEDGGEAALGGH